jgi:hypothetical protein
MNGDAMQSKLTQEGEGSAGSPRAPETVSDKDRGLTAKLGFLEW